MLWQHRKGSLQHSLHCILLIVPYAVAQICQPGLCTAAELLHDNLVHLLQQLRLLAVPHTTGGFNRVLRESPGQVGFRDKLEQQLRLFAVTDGV